jgi:hypothetical protein
MTSVARAADDLPELPLVPIDDGLTDEERKRAWAAWDAELDAAEVIAVDVTAAETLAEIRSERGH